MDRERAVAIIGAGNCGQSEAEMARELGRLLALRGYTLVSGGMGGVMRAANEGARAAGGRSIGILPGHDRRESAEPNDIRIATGLGHMRNYLVVLNADVIVAIHGGWGTLSEVALAKKIGKSVIAIGKWSCIEGVISATDSAEALDWVEQMLGKEE
ncbi:MAG: TIGR00725 family protein [Desulfocurvibacter africanus]